MKNSDRASGMIDIDDLASTVPVENDKEPAINTSSS